jgi:hypothetical protein
MVWASLTTGLAVINPTANGYPVLYNGSKGSFFIQGLTATLTADSKESSSTQWTQ